MSCAVAGCVNNKRFRPEGISFHRFPRNNGLLGTWLNVLGKDTKTWTWTKNKVVCSLHFRNEDFMITGGKRTLKLKAVPFIESSVNENQPSISQGTENSVDQSKLPLQDEICNIKIVPLSSLKQDLNQPSTSQEIESSIDQFQFSLLHEECNIKSDPLSPLKQELSETEETESCISTDSTAKRRGTIQFINAIHSYSASPQKIKMQNVKLRLLLVQYRRKLYAAKKQITALRKEVASLKSVVKDLKK